MKRIVKSFGKISMTVFLTVAAVYFLYLPATNSFLSDTASITGSIFTAGYWIPHLEMEIDPENPDGSGGFYETAPCVELSADINGEKDGIKIYYEFSNDGDPVDGGMEYGGTCIMIPDGNPSYFQAQAVNDENPDWKSDVISEDFKIKTGADSGDVVINEIMWMGSFKSNKDEWIELRNMTGHDIDLKNWRIYGAAGGNGHLQIDGNASDDYIIPANGFFLISKYDKNKSSIDVIPDLVKGSINFTDNYLKNGQVVLKDKEGNVIDSTPVPESSSWPKGLHGMIVPGGLLHFSMERDNDINGWNTCNPLVMTHQQLKTMKSYWDAGLARLFNCGTPGNANFSKNDPKSEDLDEFFTKEYENSNPADEEEEGSEEKSGAENPALDAADQESATDENGADVPSGTSSDDEIETIPVDSPSLEEIPSGEPSGGEQ